MGEKLSGRRLIAKSSKTCGEGEYEISNSGVRDSNSGVISGLLSRVFFTCINVRRAGTGYRSVRTDNPCAAVAGKNITTRTHCNISPFLIFYYEER